MLKLLPPLPLPPVLLLPLLLLPLFLLLQETRAGKLLCDSMATASATTPAFPAQASGWQARNGAGVRYVEVMLRVYSCVHRRFLSSINTNK